MFTGGSPIWMLKSPWHMFPEEETTGELPRIHLLPPGGIDDREPKDGSKKQRGA